MLISLGQAAIRLGLSNTTLRGQVHRGRLAATKIGRDWLVEEAEVERYRVASQSHPGRPFGPGPARVLEEAIQEIRINGFIGGRFVLDAKNKARVAVDKFEAEGQPAAVRSAAALVHDRIEDIMTGPDQAKLNWEPLWLAWEDLKRTFRAPASRPDE